MGMDGQANGRLTQIGVTWVTTPKRRYGDSREAVPGDVRQRYGRVELVDGWGLQEGPEDGPDAEFQDVGPTPDPSSGQLTQKDRRGPTLDVRSVQHPVLEKIAWGITKNVPLDIGPERGGVLVVQSLCGIEQLREPRRRSQPPDSIVAFGLVGRVLTLEVLGRHEPPRDPASIELNGPEVRGIHLRNDESPSTVLLERPSTTGARNRDLRATRRRPRAA